MINHNELKLRIMSMILALTILFGSLPMTVFAVGEESDSHENKQEVIEKNEITESCDKVILLHNGAEKTSVTLEEYGSEELSVFTNEIEPTGYSWQILIPNENQWVNILGKNKDNITVTHALVGSMLNENDSAYIRAIAHVGSDMYASAAVEISLSYSIEEAVESAMMFMNPRSNTMTAAEGDESTDGGFETVSIVINYIFDNGGLAFEPYGASVAKGSNFVESVKSPDIVGYDPFIRDGENYLDATTVEINLTNIQEDVTINVIYEPAIVQYQVHHHFQDLYDDAYSLTADIITHHYGVTGTIVSDDLALTSEELPGFKSKPYEKLTIAADGSTVVEIRYDRNYYLVNFDMMGGYGTEPVYARYETSVGANIPIRHGYIFDGWELVSYDGATPTTEQASKYDINSTVITLPPASLTYRARWITQLSKYTMVFWKENINDNNFSYWGSLDGLSAMSGSTVSGEDRIDEVGGIDDEEFFTYNKDLTDKNVIVEGDGSTIVNVYYTRNRYTITFKAPGLCSIPTGHSHTDECYDMLCSKDHVHDDSCTPVLSCNIPVHEAHTDECLICGKLAHTHTSACCGNDEHTHTTSCYRSIGAQSTPANAPSGVENGYIFAVRSNYRYTYYIYISGVWYRYNGYNVSSGDVVNSTCGKIEHTHGDPDCTCTIESHSHSDTCYKDTLHTHDNNNCYEYSCNKSQHTHTDGCRILDCGIPVGHNHSGTCTNAKNTNTVKIVYGKYDSNLHDIWPITDDNGVTYNSGERWEPSGSDTYSAVLVYIANMPGESFTLTLNTSKNDTYTMNYYLEVLDGDPYDVSRDGKNYKLYTTIKANYNYLTEAEDFFEIHGYYKNGASRNFTNGQIDINGGGTVDFYYGRVVDHYLEFRSNGIILSDKSVHGLPYGQKLTGYDFVPEYPASLEPGAFVFDGWYTSPGHYDGTEVDWDTITMDEGDVMLYAKWAPITHSVKVYLDASLEKQIGEEQLVSHGNFARSPSDKVENGKYIFQGWFYKDIVDGKVVEKAFVFTGIPINDDMQIYAKWTSEVSVNYKINYVLYQTGTPIADPTEGSATAGHNQTFYAKTEGDLYEGFRKGYYPLTSSHTVTMSAERDHEFTFEYVYVESMPYIVHYLDPTGNKIIESKKVLDNTLSVVTETFVKYNGMMPDAYQKRLVLSASGDDSDGDGILDNNAITFNYQPDSEHAYYRIVHYIENISGDGYREYRSEDAKGEIGETINISAISVTGFSLNGQKTVVNGSVVPTEGNTVSAGLTSEGLLVELYYDRVDVGYTVKYLEIGTNNVLYEDKHGQGIFGESVVEYAVGLNHLGYTLVRDSANQEVVSVKQIHLSANAESNVIVFYYQEAVYTLKYQIVGSPDGATLSMTSENINAVSGNPNGSMPYIDSNHHFSGWYLDEACTRPVPAEWVDEESMKITPQSDGVWLANHTYFVKIEPNHTSMTISTLGCADVDDGQIFIFSVKGLSDNCLDVNLMITIIGNSTAVIEQLPLGSYSVTELTEWSYRYTPDSVTKDITLAINESNNKLTFSHVRTNTHWLDGNAGAKNNFD